MVADTRHSEILQSTIDNEIKAIILKAEKTAKTLLGANKAKIDTMAEVLLARETIYADDIALIMKNKKAKSVITEMEKRDVGARAQESKDKIDAQLALLEQHLDEIMKMSVAYVDAKLATPEKLEQLKKNMELARKIVRNGVELKFLPTLDNLENFAKMVKDEKPVAKN